MTQLLLITDYHEFGSLYDYLRKNTLTPRQVRIRIFFFHWNKFRKSKLIDYAIACFLLNYILLFSGHWIFALRKKLDCDASLTSHCIFYKAKNQKQRKCSKTLQKTTTEHFTYFDVLKDFSWLRKNRSWTDIEKDSSFEMLTLTHHTTCDVNFLSCTCDVNFEESKPSHANINRLLWSWIQWINSN